MTRVVQAAGRLIRSAEDTGVIALLDRRFLREPYAGFLPEHWLNGEGPEALTGDPASVAAEFFGVRVGPSGY
jgi:Rad3-related DNA helicase